MRSDLYEPARDDVADSEFADSVESSPLRLKTLLVILGLHAVLALAFRADARLAALHAGGTVLAGMWWAFSDRGPRRGIIAAAYIGSAEVLWRMTKAPVFWELAKYALIVIMVSLALRRRNATRYAGVPLLYLALLVPSMVLTVDALGLTEQARQAIAFNLAGPVALGVAMGALARRQLSVRLQQELLLAMLGPLAGILAIAASGTVEHEFIEFGMASNFATSGGFGPNQVSAVLALGVVSAFLLVLRCGRSQRLLRLVLVGLALAFTAQGLLTFSRGGLLNACLALLAGGVFALRDTRTRVAFMVAALAFATVFALFVMPRLSHFTRGTLEQRFADTSTTGRTEIARAELEIFFENPIVGVGAGMGAVERHARTGHGMAAHIELTRIMAEHGLLGLLSVLMVGLLVLRSFGRARGPFAKVWIACLVAWCLAELLHSAWRLGAVSLLLGLSLADPDG